MEKDENKQEIIDKISLRKEENMIVRKIVLIVSLVAIGIFAIVGIGGFIFVNSALKPIDADATETIEVEIPIGSGLNTISTLLEEHNIIKSAKVFKYYAKFNNESKFQAGNYSLTQSMTLDEIIESLKTGKVYREPLFSITIPEGLTLQQIGERIEKHTDYTKDEFMILVTDGEFIQDMMATYPELITDEVLQGDIRYALEGYLFPATYPFFEDQPSLEEIIAMMIEQTNKVVDEYRSLLVEKEMTPHELLTFASLLEKEATAQTDRETIASVFYNRIKSDMPLQTDPTVLYSLGEHKERVLYEDLEVQNPYNTYVNKGLPPGPIANAGVSSIEATLSPSSTDYLYFLADKEGTNHFAKTYEEHLEYKKMYIDNQ